jgi:uncharacterized protein YecE (DUF72 family)
MQFGHSDDVDRVKFELPPLSARSETVLARAGALPQAEPWLRLGAPAFRHKDWIGTLYPVNAGEEDWLGIYATKLDALELNSTFYGLPSEATVSRWASETPAGFRFCPKVPRAISHELGSPELQARCSAFARRMSQLGQRLGPALFQLPPGTGPDRLPQLGAALATFPEDFALALEVRHPGWFERGELRPELADTLEARGIASVITDVSGRRDASHGTLTTSITFVRFVGEGGHPSDEPRCEAWLQRLLAWRRRGLREAYFFVHQPDDSVAPQLLARMSVRARALGIAVPETALEPPAPNQLDLFG